MISYMKISVIVTTYNNPKALQLILHSLLQQTEQAFELIIADDGSTTETRQLIEKFAQSSPIPIQHIWQDDQGFRAAAIRNKAIIAASGDYIIFLDGDVVPRQNFIAQHRLLAEKGWLVAGNRILLSATYTQQVLNQQLPIATYSWLQWSWLRLTGKMNRLLPLLTLPLTAWRKKKPTKWQGVKTCNLAVWREDLIAVNGLDEAFIGWGFEDSDLVVRLFHQGIQRKEGRFAVPVLHLWHRENDRSCEAENWQRFVAVLNSTKIKADKGLNQYF